MVNLVSTVYKTKNILVKRFISFIPTLSSATVVTTSEVLNVSDFCSGDFEE